MAFNIFMRLFFGTLSAFLTFLLAWMWVNTGLPNTPESWASCIVINILMLIGIVGSAGLAWEREV